MRRAIELDPNDSAPASNLAIVYYFARQYDNALKAAKAAVERFPGYTMPLFRLGTAYCGVKEYEKAVLVFEEAYQKVLSPVYYMLLGNAYGKAGYTEKARVVLADLTKPNEFGYINSLFVAMVHLGLGELEQAMDWIEKAYENHDGDIVEIKHSPNFDPLRGNPRFQRLIEKMNYPD